MRKNVWRLSVVACMTVLALCLGLIGSKRFAQAEKKTVALPPNQKAVSSLKKEIYNKKKEIALAKKTISQTKKEKKQLVATQKWERKFSYSSFLYSGRVVMSFLAGFRTSEKIDEAKECIKEKKQILTSERDNLNQLQKKLRQENLSQTIVFNPEDVTEVSNITKEQLACILSGTELCKFAPTYVEIEKTYGINAIAICSLSALESGWGTSKRAREDNNYTGFGVYSDDAVGINADSGEENLLMTAKHLREEYLTEGGDYDNGPGLADINMKYSVSETWANKITNIGYRLMNRLEHPEAGLDENEEN